jgi:hypothetical protein
MVVVNAIVSLVSRWKRLCQIEFDHVLVAHLADTQRLLHWFYLALAQWSIPPHETLPHDQYDTKYDQYFIATSATSTVSTTTTGSTAIPLSTCTEPKGLVQHRWQLLYQLHHSHMAFQSVRSRNMYLPPSFADQCHCTQAGGRRMISYSSMREQIAQEPSPIDEYCRCYLVQYIVEGIRPMRKHVCHARSWKQRVNACRQ